MPTATAITALSQALGIDTAEISTKTPRWMTLMQQGVIVKITIRRWRAKTKLTHKDLGIPPDAQDQIGNLLNLGAKHLLPTDLLRSLEANESAGRKALERAGYQTFWGTFVAVTNYDTWRAVNDEHNAAHDPMAAKVEATYGLWKEHIGSH